MREREIVFEEIEAVNLKKCHFHSPGGLGTTLLNDTGAQSPLSEASDEESIVTDTDKYV